MSTPVRIGAVLVVAPAVLVLASGPALAADNILISNTETVQAHLNADGTVQDTRVYEQIALQGKGTVTIKNPVSTKNLRNLDGFGSFEVKDGNVISTQTVDGDQRLRSVSDFGKVLPLKVAVTYKLDGKTVDARDVVGKSGHLEVHYTVTNVTGKDQQVTYDDGNGKKVTETQNVVIPMIGSLTTVLPSGFTDVTSGEASIAGDGRGATQLAFNMTLFGPIGSSVSEFGYSATIKDGMVPDAVIAALPVSPLDSPSFKGGAASYRAGADSGVTLTAGAMEIDANLLKLRDGAATLIAGIIQLGDGAQKLNAGLAGQAAPGALALADGASKLNSGAGQLAAGADAAKAGSGQVATGSTQLAVGGSKLYAGTGQLANAFKSPTGGVDLTSGSAALASGVAQISAGLQQLSGVAGLPSGLAGLQTLRAGLDHPVGAAGATDPGGLLQGLQQIAGGLSNPACNPLNPTNPQNPCGVKQGLASVKFGVSNPNCVPTAPTDPTNPCGIKQIVKLVGDKLTTASNTPGAINSLGNEVIEAYKQSFMAGATPCPTSTAATIPVLPVVPPTVLTKPPLNLPATNVCVQLSTAAYGLLLPKAFDPAGLGGLKDQTAAAGGALAQTGSGIDTQLLPGLSLLQTGVDRLVAGSASARDAVATLILPGVDKLIAGITDAVTGSKKLSVGAIAATSGANTLASGILQAGAGAGQLKVGAGQLSSGAGQLAVGAGQLDAGLGKLANGASLLGNGTDQLFAGANKLAVGLGDAATGSGQIADGLAKAAGDGKAIPDGATKLSTEGTSKLVEAGNTTASDYGLKYAVIVAGAERAKAEGMAYGAPAGATGATAYSLEISGANSDGGTDIGRGVGALVLFGAGGGLVFFRRRLI